MKRTIIAFILVGFIVTAVGYSFNSVAQAKVSATVTKSIGKKPWPGYKPKPMKDRYRKPKPKQPYDTTDSYFPCKIPL